MRSSRLAPTAVKAAQTTRPTSPIASRTDSAGGFALLELICALAIMALVAGIVFPRVARGPSPTDLRIKAQEIAGLLRSDRNAALRGGREILSSIDVESGRVASGDTGAVVSLPRGVKIRLTQSSKEARSGGGGIRFLPDGRSSGGVLSLERAGLSYDISVNWLTANVGVAATRAGS